MPYRSPLPNIALPDCTIFELVFGSLRGREAGLPAITEIDSGNTATYGQLRDAARAVAAILAADGAGPGDVVAMRIGNSIAFAAGLLGITLAGAAAAPISPLLTEREAAELARLSGARRELTAAQVRRACDGASLGASVSTPPFAPPPPAPLDLAVIPFSSGTTGLPKAVELTHAALTANAAQFGAALAASGVRPGTRVAAPLPFSHIYGLNTLLLSSLASRHHVFTAARFDLAGFAAAHETYGIELSFIAPPIALALAKDPAVDPAAFTASRWMVCGAAPLDESLARAVEDRLATTVLQGYGTTESGPVTHVGLAGRTGPGSIGVAVPNTQFRIVEPAGGAAGDAAGLGGAAGDAAGLGGAAGAGTRGGDAPGDPGALVDVAPGAPGELVVRGPQLMRGYRGDEAATRRALKGGWLRTGDLARVLPDGSVAVIDRVKEVIKYHGYQVPPAELEALLLTHPQVADAAVVGVVRAGDGEEVPKAFVVLRGASISKQALLDWVAQRVAPYKKIREVEFVDAIPRNAAGKILRRELR